MKKCAQLFAAFVLTAAGAYAGDAPATVSGKWEMTREFNGRTMTTTFDIQQEGETLKGTVTGGRENHQNPLTGTVKGNKVEISYSSAGRDGETRTRQLSGTVDGDEMKLEFETPGGKREATARRTATTDAPAADAKPKN